MSTAKSYPLAPATLIGWYNLAQSYLICGQHVARSILNDSLNATHIHLPAQFLFYNCVELSLKGYLISYGYTSQGLKNRYRHKVGELYKEATRHGIVPNRADDALCEFIQLDVFNARYLQPSYTVARPTLRTLDKLAVKLLNNLRRRVFTKRGKLHERATKLS